MPAIERSERGRWLERHRDAVAAHRRIVSASESTWSWGRLGTFIVAAAGWAPFLAAPWVAAGVSALGGAGFVLAVLRHRRYRAQRESDDRLLGIIEESGRRCGGSVELIRSHERPHPHPKEMEPLPSILGGGRRWRLSEQECDDLDLYSSPVGLFGLLNRTSTPIGARRLSEWMESPLLEPDSIASRQAAVRRLDESPSERMRMMAGAASLRLEKRALYGLILALQQVKPLDVSMSVRGLRLWSIATLVVAMIAVYQVFQGELRWLSFLLLLMIVNGMVLFRLRRALADCLKPWQNVAPAAAGYLIAARQAAADLPEEGELGRLRERFEQVIVPDGLPGLAWRVGSSEGGGAMHELFNLIAFHDLHVAASILRCALPYKEELLDGLGALAELEALLSLGCYGWEQPAACYATFEETALARRARTPLQLSETPAPVPVTAGENDLGPASEPAEASEAASANSGALLEIQGGRHPLVRPERVIANDVRLDADQRMWIITGSNMSGKSTFIRMVGLNVLLAQVGCAVTADSMRLTPLRLLTDLRARDDLSLDASYFLAEVRQLKRMLLPPPGYAPVLGLIDEPLRGTNSAEQIAASVAVVEHLLGSGHLFLIATHDFKLTELADGRSAANVHFQEDLDHTGLVFDYTLRAGPATTRNALRILEREGYPQSVVQRARECVLEADDSDPGG